jgi:hypothetical protein
MCLFLVVCTLSSALVQWDSKDLRSSITVSELHMPWVLLAHFLAAFRDACVRILVFSMLGPLLPPFLLFSFCSCVVGTPGAFCSGFHHLDITEFCRSFSFQIFMFDTVTDFCLLIFNVFSSEPFGCDDCSLQERERKKKAQQILGRVGRQSMLLMEASSC